MNNFLMNRDPHMSKNPFAALPLFGQYEIIYADPPWQYDVRHRNGCAEGHYGTMSLEEIKSLPVSELVTDNAVLLIWATCPLLAEALEVITAWGFTYKTMGFTWIKRNRSECGFFFGLGRWTRGNAELCLLATRGKPERVGKGVSQLVFEPLGKHSAKPAIVRDKICELLGDRPRVELFAREKTQGWHVWGNEV